LTPVEIKLSKNPSLGMIAGIARFRKLFSSLSIKKGFLVSLTEKTSPLTAALSASTFDDYLRAGTAEVSEPDLIKREDHPSTMLCSSHINQLPVSVRNECVFRKMAKCSSSSLIRQSKKAFSVGVAACAAAFW